MAKYFKCLTNKEPVLYTVGEEIEFTVFAKEDDENISCENLEWKLRGDDGQSFSGVAQITPENPLKLTYTLKRAGFVHLHCVAKDSKGEKLEGFDELNSSAGADVKTLKYSNSLPEDFDEYWAEIKKMVDETEIKVVYYKEKEPEFRKGFKVFQVQIETPCGRPASGCVTIPLGGEKYPIRISFLGYGVHAAFYEYDENKICACFNAHGFENTKNDEELSKIYGKELSWYGFDDVQNASKYDTYYRNMMIRNFIALKYTKTLPEWNGKDIISNGGSQGALQAITLAAHNKDVTLVEAFKPWFCDINAENEGYLGGWRPKFAEGLRYFDTVAQGMRLECPIVIECYLGDYVCPPKTVMALYNHIKSPKTIKFVQSGTHSYFPPDNRDKNPDYIFEEK
jgi:cephalosporin-C deacetylase-like acetyl esterase